MGSTLNGCSKRGAMARVVSVFGIVSLIAVILGIVIISYGFLSSNLDFTAVGLAIGGMGLLNLGAVAALACCIISSSCDDN